jgi:hypothetical protein
VAWSGLEKTGKLGERRIEVVLLQNDFYILPFVVYFFKYWSSIMEK